MAAPRPYDQVRINGPSFATFQIVTDEHDPRGNVTVEKRRSAGTTVHKNLFAPFTSLKAGGACVQYALSVDRPLLIPR